MKKPPSLPEIISYINNLKLELSDKYHTYNKSELNRIEDEIRQWEIIIKIKAQL